MRRSTSEIFLGVQKTPLQFIFVTSLSNKRSDHFLPLSNKRLKFLPFVTTGYYKSGKKKEK